MDKCKRKKRTNPAGNILMGELHREKSNRKMPKGEFQWKTRRKQYIHAQLHKAQPRPTSGCVLWCLFGLSSLRSAPRKIPVDPFPEPETRRKKTPGNTTKTTRRKLHSFCTEMELPDLSSGVRCFLFLSLVVLSMLSDFRMLVWH